MLDVFTTHTYSTRDHAVPVTLSLTQRLPHTYKSTAQVDHDVTTHVINQTLTSF